MTVKSALAAYSEQAESAWQEHLVLHGYAVLDGVPIRAVAPILGDAGQAHLLEARSRSAADPWTLSGVYGRSAFPWHTDGAVSTRPPRWILMRAVQIEVPTATEVLMPSPGLVASLRRTVLRVVDKAGRARHLPAVVALPDGSLRFRWDPRIGRPRMGVTVEDVEDQPATAHVAWQPGRILILDNFRILHRRPPVPDGVTRVLERTYVWSS